MTRLRNAVLGLAVGAGLALAGAPAAADVKAGVDAWSRGDYAAAVEEWKVPAARGDADAQFNLAQAYRLGRGVPEDLKIAESYYAKAAAQGHIKAADNYGLLLFQDGRREQAMPYVTAAAARGDPRAQYLLGVAHFNGDLVTKDWVRAYALLTLANSAGLPQAAPALKQMDEFIPLAQRQQAQSLAVELKREADAQRASQLAAADLAAGEGPVTVLTARQAAVAPSAPRTPAAPLSEVVMTPSVAAAQAAVAEAMRATGTESPAYAGADYARPDAAASVRTAQASPPAVTPRVARAATPVESRRAPAAPSGVSDGPWKVQLGAFGIAANADRLWAQIGAKGVLAGKARLIERSGRLTKLQAGGWASRAAAQQACNALKASGHDCLVTR